VTVIVGFGCLQRGPSAPLGGEDDCTGFHKDSASDPTGKKVGVLAGVLAVLLAVVTIASHRTHTAAIMHNDLPSLASRPTRIRMPV